MHNIFLGIAKHTMKTWKDLKIIGTKNNQSSTYKIGRIPRKIVSGFAAITADEWKHWILIYSLYALHGILPTADYKCWCLLVQSCQLLSLPVISKDQIETAHALLVKFCKSFEHLYSAQYCTPNMHMACHLKTSMLDFGPLSSFWCFPFERFN